MPRIVLKTITVRNNDVYSIEFIPRNLYDHDLDQSAPPFLRAQLPIDLDLWLASQSIPIKYSQAWEAATNYYHIRIVADLTAAQSTYYYLRWNHIEHAHINIP
jgi:hypothetical protein